jgi:hypothetical protein
VTCAEPEVSAPSKKLLESVSSGSSVPREDIPVIHFTTETKDFTIMPSKSGKCNENEKRDREEERYHFHSNYIFLLLTL